MPLASEKGLIARVPKYLGKRDLLNTKIAIVLWWQVGVLAIRAAPRLAGPVTDPSRNSMFRRVFASEDTCARGAAYLTRCIASRELHSLAGNPVDMWAFIEFRAFVAQIAPTKIISKDKDDVWLSRSVGKARDQRHTYQAVNRNRSTNDHGVSRDCLAGIELNLRNNGMNLVQS